MNEEDEQALNLRLGETYRFEATQSEIREVTVAGEKELRYVDQTIMFDGMIMATRSTSDEHDKDTYADTVVQIAVIGEIHNEATMSKN
jgi:hypothetical protein